MVVKLQARALHNAQAQVRTSNIIKACTTNSITPVEWETVINASRLDPK